jgi:hypothetical protein
LAVDDGGGRCSAEHLLDGGVRSAVLLLLLPSCALFAPKKNEPATKSTPASPRPSWVDQTAFIVTSTTGASPRLAGVGQESVAPADPCWSSGVLLAAVKNRALAELAKVLDVAPESEAAIAALKGAEVRVGWFDGDHTVYALATIDAADKKLREHAPSGGVPIAQLEAQLKEAARAHLDQTGACKDPYKRLDVKCCGGPATFCSDSSRFDKQAGATCACGDGPPCHQDFKCEERQGAKKCICRGKSCPCEVRGCSIGQTCGDGRCY